MKKINFITGLVLFSCVLLYACSKNNIDITDETQDPFTPGVEEVLLVDSGVWELTLDTSLFILDSCYLSIYDTAFVVANANYTWNIAAANASGIWPWYYINFTSLDLAPGVYKANRFSTREYIAPDFIDKVWENTQLDIDVEILEVGEVGEGVSGTMSGKLINDDGSETFISAGFSQLYRYY